MSTEGRWRFDSLSRERETICREVEDCLAALQLRPDLCKVLCRSPCSSVRRANALGRSKIARAQAQSGARRRPDPDTGANLGTVVRDVQEAGQVPPAARWSCMRRSCSQTSGCCSRARVSDKTISTGFHQHCRSRFDASCCARRKWCEWRQQPRGRQPYRYSPDRQTSNCSASSRASSTSIPRYRTVRSGL